MDINYELYKVLYHVAISLSFSEASKKLYISQSAVSQSIKVLEKKLNRTLFIRSTKKVQLTPEGEILLRHVEPAMNLIRRGEAQIMETDTLNGGQLHIGASDTICRYFLVPYLNRFHKEYPHIHIKVTNQTSIRCVDLLENGSVDLIFTNYPNSRLDHSFHIRYIREFHDCFIASRKYYGELEHQALSFQELLEYPILMLGRNSTTSEGPSPLLPHFLYYFEIQNVLLLTLPKLPYYTASEFILSENRTVLIDQPLTTLA